MSNNIVDTSMAKNALADQEMVQRKIQMDALRNNFGDSTTQEQKLRETCEGFESIFIQKMWEQMRSNVPKEGYLHSKEEEVYQGMFDQEFAKKMASAGGIGLGDMLYEQLSMKLGDSGRTTNPQTRHDPLAIAPTRMDHMQPRPKPDYTAHIQEAQKNINLLVDASKVQDPNAELYAPLNEALNAASENSEESFNNALLNSALEDLTGMAQESLVQAHLSQAQAQVQASLAAKASPTPRMPLDSDELHAKQPSAIGRVVSPRNAAASARSAISPYDRVEKNAEAAEAKDELRLLKQAKSTASRAERNAQKAQANNANYVSMPLAQAVGTNNFNGQASNSIDALGTINALGADYSGADGLNNELTPDMGGIQAATGTTILPPAVRAKIQQQREAQLQAQAQAQTQGQVQPPAQGQALDPRAASKVAAQFNIPLGAMTPDQAQIARAEVAAGSQAIVEPPLQQNRNNASSVRQQPIGSPIGAAIGSGLGAGASAPAAFGRTNIQMGKELSQNGLSPNLMEEIANAGIATGAKPVARTLSKPPAHIPLNSSLHNPNLNNNSQLPVSGKVSSNFGWENNLDGQKVWNAGVNIASVADAPVSAVVDGTVAFAGEHADYGNLVVLEHDNGVKSYYGNAVADASTAQIGTKIKAGTEFAKISMRDQNDPAHLRFEARRGELAINPTNFLSGSRELA